jgi:hypothetical protein
LKEGGESEQALSPSNEGMKPTNFIWLIWKGGELDNGDPT